MPLRLPRSPHRWSLSPKQAIAVQRRLAAQVRTSRTTSQPFRWVAGLDAAFADHGRVCVAAVVLWDLEAGCPWETHLARRPVRFPYIPGLLSFREAPALLAALRRLSRPPDVLMCDGHGLAHPRRLGIASHLGLLTGRPSVGCAKSILIGVPGEPGAASGARAPLRIGCVPVGEVVRTRGGVRPVYVSVGHDIDIDSAIGLVLACCRGYRLPEPTRLADRAVARARGEGAGADATARARRVG